MKHRRWRKRWDRPSYFVPDEVLPALPLRERGSPGQRALLRLADDLFARWQVEGVRQPVVKRGQRR